MLRKQVGELEIALMDKRGFITLRIQIEMRGWRASERESAKGYKIYYTSKQNKTRTP